MMNNINGYSKSASTSNVGLSGLSLMTSTERIKNSKRLPEVLFITSYPPRECGIATYTQDLVKAIEASFGFSFTIRICALEAQESFSYPPEVKYVLPTTDFSAYERLALEINNDSEIGLVVLQHEFGLFGGTYGQNILELLCLLSKPVITTFHTILPAPDELRRKIVETITMNSVSVIVMTRSSAAILTKEYNVPEVLITVIPHGTHLVTSIDHTEKTARNHLGNRMVLTTFGLLSPGKSIETALDALPEIILNFPNVLYLIIGKTHPEVVRNEGETYRQKLEQKVLDLRLQGHVRFVNKYLPLQELLGYLQRTDIYLFTSKDPFQAVSGTFAYAMGCGCPVISTPIPHAKEILQGAGLIVDFQNPVQLSIETIRLLQNPERMREMKLNALHKIRPTAWPNAALTHVSLIVKHSLNPIQLDYTLPELSLAHLLKLTTEDGIIQFSKLSTPDIESGYTIDDNARALIVVANYASITGDHSFLPLIDIYLNFILHCQQPDGTFLNYVDTSGNFHLKNDFENLEDANGRAFWALGEFISLEYLFDPSLIQKAEGAFLKALGAMMKMRSPRAIAFVTKGLFYYNTVRNEPVIKSSIVFLADDLVSKYVGVSDPEWQWLEEYLTYANAVLPEALLCAYQATGIGIYKEVAKSCFDFLLTRIYKGDEIHVISNQDWLTKGGHSHPYGEQPIDVAYTVLALARFKTVFEDTDYSRKMISGYDWFLGKNHLMQIIYNPMSGGCYDGLEEHHINLNQGAESTLSHLMARLTLERQAQMIEIERKAIPHWVSMDKRMSRFDGSSGVNQLTLEIDFREI